MPTDREQITVPLSAERVEVSRREVVTGRVTVRTVTTQHQVVVDEPIIRSHVEIERVPVGIFVDEAPQLREEGDVTVVPVIEEVLVKRLFLKEEVRLRRITETVRQRETVVLRAEDAIITREPPGRRDV